MGSMAGLPTAWTPILSHEQTSSAPGAHSHFWLYWVYPYCTTQSFCLSAEADDIFVFVNNNADVTPNDLAFGKHIVRLIQAK